MSPSIDCPALTIGIEPLTQEAFQGFGQVIQNKTPHLSPSYLNAHDDLHADATIANQGTALKYANVTNLTDEYPQSSSKPLAKPSVSLFSCHPRPLANSSTADASSRIARGMYSMGSSAANENSTLEVKVLERHPFTSQTFVPLGLSPAEKRAYYLVVVAPNDTVNSNIGVTRPPDLQKARAFLARGDQAVTYAAGTWHAPMIVLGSSKIDFVVWQFANGIHGDDCQEIGIVPASPALGALNVQTPAPVKWPTVLAMKQNKLNSTFNVSKL